MGTRCERGRCRAAHQQELYVGAPLHPQTWAPWPETPCAFPVPPRLQCPPFLEQGWNIHLLSRTRLPCLLGAAIWRSRHPSQRRVMHKQCMGEWRVRADHACFSSLPGRPVWPQLPGDMPESPGLQGAELLPAGPLRLLLRLRLEWLSLQPRYGDVVVHQLTHPAWASSRAHANLSQPESWCGLSGAAACTSCPQSLRPWSCTMTRGSSGLSSSRSLSPRILRPRLRPGVRLPKRRHL